EEAPCAERIVQHLARDAYRRPVPDRDMKELMSFYQRGRDGQGGSFDEGIRHALTAILASPYFLYRSEPVPQTVSAGGSYRINDYELASRLSFFLWSTGPDDELLKVASENQL